MLDLFKVFVQPQSQWGRENFGQVPSTYASAHGYVEVGGTFKAGQVLLDEMTLFPENLATSRLWRQTLSHHSRDGGPPCTD